MFTEAEWVAFIALLLGVVVRTGVPYFQKLRADGVAFELKFMVTALLTIVLGAIPLVMGEWESFIVPEGTLWIIFLSGFLIGLGMNDAFNRFLITLWSKPSP